MCVAPAAPPPLWAVPGPPGHEKRTPTDADAHDLKIVVKLRAVPASKVPFPVEIAGFPDFSRPVPVYPVFLKYVVPVQLRLKLYTGERERQYPLEVKEMENYTKTNIGSEARVELHEKLGLTGAEVSINQLPAGAGVPFVHAHRNNEEIYGIIAGKGKAVIDGKEIALTAGDWLKVAPAAKRQFSAAADEGITYICIQVKEHSLGGFTAEDAVIF